MPKKAKCLPFDKNKRCRISVELDDASLAQLGEMLTLMQASGNDVSISNLVRTAIRKLYDGHSWKIEEMGSLSDKRVLTPSGREYASSDQ